MANHHLVVVAGKKSKRLVLWSREEDEKRQLTAKHVDWYIYLLARVCG